MPRIKLIAFDLDGVLTDGCGSWREIHKSLGTYEDAELHAREYYSGRITFEEWAKKDVSLWYGIEIEKIKKILYKIPLINGIEHTIPKLKENHKLVIISGGLQILADRIRNRFNLDNAIANKLIVENGRVSGIDLRVDFEGKGNILKRITKEYGIKLKECAAIGDFVNDVSMFKVAGFSIAFNPQDEKVTEFADEVVYGKDLKRILPFFDNNL